MGGELHCWPHLVNWLILFLSKKDGGLGIRKLSTMDKALLGNGAGDLHLRINLFGHK